MAITNLGRVGFVPKGVYGQSTSYRRLDIVSDTDGNTYVAIADSQGASLTDSTKWMILVNASEANAAASDARSAATEALDAAG